MSTESTPSGAAAGTTRFRIVSIPIAAVLGFAALAAALTWASGALDCGFGTYDDEASHVVSALMVRDWIADGFPSPARQYAESYYVHYPKVAIGQWPPLLPLWLGAWMLAFGTSVASVLAFYGAMATAAAALAYSALRRTGGEALAITAGAVVVAMPLVQEFSHLGMTELPLAVLCTAAVLQFGVYIDRGRSRAATLFGLFALAAILVKGSALALALVPLLSVALARRYDAIKRLPPWIAAAFVLLGAGPWYVLTLDISLSTWGGGHAPNWNYFTHALRYYGLGLGAIGGVGLAVLAVIGAVDRLRADEGRGRAAALTSWILALLAAYVLMPTGLELRHLAVLAPAVAILAAWGAAAVVRRIPSRSPPRPAWAALLLLALFAPAFRVHHKYRNGCFDAALAVVADPHLDGCAILVASDPKGEGTFIAGSAVATDERPGHTLLRASKLLGSSDWMGNEYVARFDDVEELGTWLRDVPVAAIVFDASTPRDKWFPHHTLLESYLAGAPGGWELAGEFDSVRAGVRFPRAVRLYVQSLANPRPRRAFTFAEVSGRNLGNLRSL